jgi:hypothetical protein
VNLKTQRESREDTRGIHSPRESDVIAKGDKVAEPRHTQSAPTNNDMGMGRDLCFILRLLRQLVTILY